MEKMQELQKMVELVMARGQGGCGVMDPYRATERRLYALEDLRSKVQDDQLRLEEYRQGRLDSRSASFIRLNRSGTRLTPEEMAEALCRDVESSIARNQYEINQLERALQGIERDCYYQTVHGRYIQGKTDERLAEELCCDPSTVRRNRKRLVQRLAVRLYGIEAVE
jgi:hypothetical protein